MVLPGLRKIEKVKLAKKWRRLIPEEFQDDICPIPDNDIINSVRKDISKKRKNKGVTSTEADTTVSYIIDTNA